MVVFFDHVVLHLDGFNIDETNKSEIIDKLNAYIEKGYISILDLDQMKAANPEGSIVTPISLKDPHVNFHKIRNSLSLEMTIVGYLQIVGELETFKDIKVSEVEIKKVIQIVNKKKYIPGSGFWLDIGWPGILNRSNIFSILGSIFECSLIYDQVMRNFRTIKFNLEFNQNQKMRKQ